MSLHRADPRFLLPHRVRTAVVLDGLEEWLTGLASAGIDIVEPTAGAEQPDVAVTTARLARAAIATNARSIILEGSPAGTFRGSDYEPRKVLLRPTRARPTLALPLDQPAAVSYALERWSVVDRRWKTARVRAARTLVSRGLFPSWASPIVTVATRCPGPPELVFAAGQLGIPADTTWFLTFGQGDALSRNAFQIFPVGHAEPEWVLKFARVAGYSERFDNDARGLQLAHAAGDVVAQHVPRLVGRFEVDGVHASVESAAVGNRLRDVLLTPGNRTMKLSLIERIAEWILELGRRTRSSPHALEPELIRLRDDVVPEWSDIGAGPELVEALTAIPGVTQHNDLGAWNVVADGPDFVVVDWENARQAALPLWDLLYFLGNAFVLLDDGVPAPERLPEEMARLFAGESASSPLLFSLLRRAVEAAAIPPAAIPPIATLCWLSHSLSAGAHNVDLATFTPMDPPRMHGLEGMAKAWMTHRALGSGWSAWRD